MNRRTNIIYLLYHKVMRENNIKIKKVYYNNEF